MDIISLCDEHGTDTILDAIERAVTEQAEGRGVPLELLAQCESYPERAFLTAAWPMFPSIKPQYTINGFRADFAIPDRGLLIEIDGRAYHDDRSAVERDRKRDRRLAGCGWRILRFSAKEILDHAARCVGEVLSTPEPLPFDGV